MITVQRTFTLDQPAESVFTYLSDFAHAAQWDPGTRSCERLDSGPIAVGARWHNVSEFRGRTTELEYRLTRFDPNTRLTFFGQNKTVDSTDELTLRPDGEHTSITYQAQLRFRGLARLAEPLLKGSFEKIADETVAQMQRSVATL